MSLDDTATAPGSSPSANDLAVIQPGMVVGRYELRARVGAGGMGVVYAARDPELDRDVAVKFIRDALGTEGEDRLRREGQAMARLAHPNVLPVYDVGFALGRIFVAMELVEGGTLGQWVAKAGRTAGEILRAYLQAGRGLAAAHAAGLVHRDFKPSNVLVAADGRVLVTDFGLARPTGGDAPIGPAPPDAPANVTVESSDGVVGTPAFMPPEQAHGEAVDARADQFAFACALWQALYQAQPYRGATLAAIVTAAEARELVPPTAAMRKRAPAHVREALERALDPEPARRFPAMTDLLAAIERPRHVAAYAGIGAAVAITAGAILWGALSGKGGEACPSPDTATARVWNADRARAITTALAKVDPAQGATRAAAPYLRTWRTVHVAACKANRVAKTEPDTVLDLRVRCLDQRLTSLGAALASVEQASDPMKLDRAITQVVRLPSPQVCGDATLTERALAAPLVPEQRSAIEALTERLDALQAPRLATNSGAALAEAAVAEARTLGHVPTLAYALQVLAKTYIDLRQSDAAVKTLEELTQTAARAKDPRAEAWAWILLISIIGNERSQPELGLTHVPAARAAIARAGDPLDLRVRLLYGQAQVLDNTPRVSEALALLAEAERLLASASPAERTADLEERRADVLLETATALDVLGDSEAALVKYQEATARYRELFGPDTLDEAMVLHNVAETLRHLGRPEDAIASAREAARINRARAGKSHSLAENLVTVGAALGEADRWEEALAAYDEALAIDREILPPNDIELVPLLLGRSLAYKNLKRRDEAKKGYDEVIALYEATGASDMNLAITRFNRGEMALAAGDLEASIADHTQAAKELEAMLGPSGSRLCYPLFSLGKAYLLNENYAMAIGPLSRVLQLEIAPREEKFRIIASLYVGVARVLSRLDRKGGLALVKAGRAALEADPKLAPELEELRTLWYPQMKLKW
jgi:tetratricopeptide (TPR) repeat protein/predicted Ser/Thr protein kinase